MKRGVLVCPHMVVHKGNEGVREEEARMETPTPAFGFVIRLQRAINLEHQSEVAPDTD